jgi:peptidoglycan/LPS O-acetylase OafA/YrhL
LTTTLELAPAPPPVQTPPATPPPAAVLREPRARGVAYLTVLDGLRGLAACIVLVAHVMVFFSQGEVLAWFAPHAYLAVDCFFVMSGFVMAHAFDDKLKAGMTVRDFALHRFLRLYPLVLAGAVLGAVSLMAYWVMTPGVPLSATLQAIAAGALLLPSDALARFKPYEFPVNIAFWSLSFEIILCVGYAVFARFLTGERMVAALAVSACGVVWLAEQKPSLDIGFRAGEFLPAFGRVIYPFLIGIFLRRLPAFQPRRSALGYLAIPLLGLLLVNPLPMNGVYDAVAVVAGIPLLVWMAATARGFAPLDRFAAAGGTLSYPLYALHFPIVVMLANLGKKLGVDEGQNLLLAMSAILISVSVATLTYMTYDKPVRAWLRKRLPFSSPKWS